MKWIIILVVIASGCSSPIENKKQPSKSEDKWYVLADKEYGPIGLQKLRSWCEEGRILPDTLVRKCKGKYRFAKNFTELQETLNTTPQDIEFIEEKEIPLIPNVTHGLQPEEKD